MPRLCSSPLLSLLIAVSASAVTMYWVPIGNPGNLCDPQAEGCFGSVSYEYQISRYEVTNAQYAEFLNAKAASDSLGLYTAFPFYSDIKRSGASGDFTYSVNPGRESMPANFVSFYDALRFANWMNNGQGSSDTETGAYTLLGGTATPSNGTSVTRNLGASIFLTSENEWYKAAYYSPSGVYHDYPAGTNTVTVCSTPTAAANRANCGEAVGGLTARGSYTGSASPYGTFDQGGNVWEWNESIVSGSNRVLRGGGAESESALLGATVRGSNAPIADAQTNGFRLVMIPEPGTGLLVIAGLLGLAIQRRIST